MRIYFTDHQIPELKRLPKAIRRAARNECLLPMWRRYLWGLWLLIMFFTGLGMAVGKVISSTGSADLVGMMAGAQIGFQIYVQWIYERARPGIRRYMAQHHEAYTKEG